MSQYSDESHAVARAINAGEGRPKPAHWQGQYNSGYRESRVNDSDVLTGIERLLGDSMARSLIHRSLTEPQWLILVAKYSGEQKDQVKAIDRLATLLSGKAGPKNRRVWVSCWAVPAMQIRYGKQVIDWDGEATPDRTLSHWRADVRKQLTAHMENAMSHLAHVLKNAGLIA